jgi:hypothetical protein
MSEHTVYGGPPASQSEDSTQDSGSEVPPSATLPNDRRRSSSKMPGLKRAFSSPNMITSTTEDNVAMSALDKKRNKLGYHRTAVACGRFWHTREDLEMLIRTGHCRRRKIRCIPAANDHEGRCQNCIRLKKDCQFFPVDQQGTPPTRRPRAGSRVGGSSIDTDDTGRASPRVLTSSSLEQIKSANGQINTPPLTDDGSVFQHFGSGAPSSLHGRQLSIPLEPMLTSADSGHTDYDFNSRYSGTSRQMYHQANHSQLSQASEQTHFDYPSNRFYASQSPYTSPPLSGPLESSPQSNTGHFPQQSPRNMDFGWAAPQPLRSMSIAGSHDLQNMYPMYRSNTFPRRMDSAVEPPRPYEGRASHDYQDPGMYNQYHQHPYQQMHMPSSAAWTPGGSNVMSTVPTSAGDSYHAAWYHQSQILPFVSEEDASTHIQQPLHPKSQFRPNPG